MIGETISHYRIVEKLGSGGMGDVYLAEDTRLHRRVAVKALPAATSANPEQVERFAREARAVAALNHPNIVTVHGIEEVEGRRLLVMELIEGRTLDEAIPPGGLADDRFFDIAIPLADALSAAHERGVTHRDVKPSNVMIGEDGRVKVVDFGLAKLRMELEAHDRTVALDDDLTEDGRVLGTYPYMSPEQIKGKPADHRSDIFSVGVVLYEMVTGERPFAGETSADLVSAILRDAPPRPSEVNRRLPRHLDRIIEHCLEKDPERRFQTARDLCNELTSLRREVESERLLRSTAGWRRLLGVAKVRRSRRPGRKRYWLGGMAAAGLLAILLALALAFAPDVLDRRERPAAAVPAGPLATATEERPSVAILFFQNLTGDPELEWMRRGLTEMLVTDLSQTPGLRVLGTDRLYQILHDLGELDTPLVSADTVAEIGDRARVDTILTGSFAKAGDTLQVQLTLKDPVSGEILHAQRAQGVGESSIFSVVDRLSGQVREAFAHAGRLHAGGREWRIESVTTSSVEAYRLYVRGMEKTNEFQVGEAVAFLERAVELDRGFAMAHAQLARIYETLGREKEHQRAVNEAMEHADRLPPRERHYIEGVFYSQRRATYDRAIETLERAVELYPDHHAARYQLGLLYSYVELHDRAAEQFEELLHREHDTDAVYNSLAAMHVVRGDVDRARQLLENLVEEHPERWAARLVLAFHAVNWGDPETALEALDQAEAIQPGTPFVDFVRWRAEAVDGRWDEAAAAARDLIEGQAPYWRWRGHFAGAHLALVRGRPADALERLDRAERAYEADEPLLGTSLNLAARILLDRGDAAAALAETERARTVAAGDWPGWEARFWAAVAHQRLGRAQEADRLAAELAEIADSFPGEVEERLHRRLLGRLALERGDFPAAADHLRRAAEMLPPRGLAWHRHRLPDHAGIWFDLATAAERLGDEREAERWYRRVVESGVERLYYPLEAERSRYRLARILDRRGERDAARGYYRAFLDAWGEGQIDRDAVEAARRRLADLGG